MTPPVLIALAVAAALLCAVLVPPVRALARAWGALDEPGARRIHEQTTPRLGGLAVFAAFLLVVVAGFAVGILEPGAGDLRVPAFVAGALLVLAVGALDDKRHVPALVKLAVEIVAALIVVYAGDCRINAISSPGGFFRLGLFAIPFTVLWIVLVTNAINLIDGMDGLAAGASTIALAAVAVVATGFDMPNVAALAVILAGACVGFLVHNFHPASIFLGDSGSLFIGFSLGVLSSYARAKGTTGAITLATLLLLALPLGDTLLAVERRYRTGLAASSLRSHLGGLSRILRPDRNHLHHRLLRSGLGQRAASFTLYALQAIACIYAVYLLVRG
jgi:UDP-GlcNAc:undecaprenyl-phosphate GlcNAc-1-phosphate transferase